MDSFSWPHFIYRAPGLPQVFTISKQNYQKVSVEVLDSATIVNFVEDEKVFGVSIRYRFAHLDTDQGGPLSYAEMLRELQCLRVFESHFGVNEETDPNELARGYGSLFLPFDHDLNGTVDLEEFKDETKKMTLAMASGLGFLPVQMVLEEGGFLKKAVEREFAAQSGLTCWSD